MAGIGDLTGTASFWEVRMAGHDAAEGNPMVTVHVYRAEEGGFWAEMPEYPGCYTQGETMDDLKENVREAVQCYVDAGYADQRTSERTEKPEILQVAL